MLYTIDMFSDPRIIQAFAAGFSFFISALLSFFLFTTSGRDRSAKTFAFTLLTIAIWGLFGFFFEITPTSKVELARIFRIISVIFIPALTASFGYFSLVFYEENMGSRKKLFRIGMIISFFLAGIIIFLLILDLFKVSGFIVQGINSNPRGLLEPVPGPFFHILYLYFSLGAFYTGYVLWKSRSAPSPFIKNQVAWMVASIVVGFLAGASRFTTWYGVNSSPAIASLAAPIFGIGFFYAIVKHRLFHIRVITAELLTFSIWGFLFLLIVFSDTTEQRIINTILFVATVILGIFLIRGTLREVSQREELAKANAELKNLNQNLEEIVRERTGELVREKLHTDAIIENLVLGLIEYSNDFTILRVNKAAEELLGFKREHVIGKRISGEDVKNKELQSLAEIIHMDPSRGTYENPVEHVGEISIRYPIPCELQTITFKITSETSGNDTQFVKIIRDITREKLIDKNKSDFITIVAHQLRTPLSAIKWVFNMVLENKDGFSVDHAKTLRDGSQATERMIHLINDLLDVVRIEDGRFGYEFRQNDIIKTIADVTGNMKTRADWKKISLNVEFPHDQLPAFVFDESRISLAITNIIENAIDYTPEGGSVNVVAQKENGKIKISVKDTGMGIQKGDMQKLLITKFFRSAHAIGAQTDGSGLGLFISNNIIRSHKGTVVIESEENKGTTVSITIPTTLSEEDTPKPRLQAQKATT